MADTQQVAFQVALLALVLPAIILSGFIFPIPSMPAVLQAVTYVVPARYFLVALRGIVLKGAGLVVFWQDLPRWRSSPGGARPRLAAAATGRRDGMTAALSRVAHLVARSSSSSARIRACSASSSLAPLIQLTVLGYAANTDVKDVPMLVVDGDRSEASRAADRAASTPRPTS